MYIAHRLLHRLPLQFGTLCPFPLIPSKNLLHGRFDLPRNVALFLIIIIICFVIKLEIHTVLPQFDIWHLI